MFGCCITCSINIASGTVQDQDKPRKMMLNYVAQDKPTYKQISCTVLELAADRHIQHISISVQHPTSLSFIHVLHLPEPHTAQATQGTISTDSKLEWFCRASIKP
ncbi:hypothetical protein ABBQ32_000162 [Trebouxia sp. C0010 RCD-2024]